MHVDGEPNFRAFCYKQLFDILFVRTTSVQVSSGSTFSASGMGLVPFKFPDYHALHLLIPAY